MNPLEALADVCRHFCVPDQHDPACIALHVAVADLDYWRADVIRRDALEVLTRQHSNRIEPVSDVPNTSQSERESGC